MTKTVELTTSAGVIRLELDEAKAPTTVANFLSYVNKGHYEHMDRFLTHIEGKGENPCDIEGAVAVNRVTLKLVESARMVVPVAVNPEDWHIPAPISSR